jgi:hypothetical protein
MFWNFENINAIRREHLSPVLSYFAPRIMFAPEKFEYDGYQGSNESWEDFGKWIWAMNQGRDNLPPERVAHLNALVANFDNDRDKVRAIYEFMQSRTRYVNISLGIGGIQPFDAETVDRTGYGDCKALTNYMMAMLKAVGIESFYTLVRAGVGRYNIVNDFTSNQFNHVILSVPLKMTPFGWSVQVRFYPSIILAILRQPACSCCSRRWRASDKNPGIFP